MTKPKPKAPVFTGKCAQCGTEYTKTGRVGQQASLKNCLNGHPQQRVYLRVAAADDTPPAPVPPSPAPADKPAKPAVRRVTGYTKPAAKPKPSKPAAATPAEPPPPAPPAAEPPGGPPDEDQNHDGKRRPRGARAGLRALADRARARRPAAAGDDDRDDDLIPGIY